MPEEEEAHVTLMCGSPGEVANSPALGDRYAGRLATSTFDNYGVLSLLPNHFSVYGHGPNKQGIHAMQALYAEDQLRQRVAFALSQIFVIASEDVGLIGSSTEPTRAL